MSKIQNKKYGLLGNIIFVYKGVAEHKPYFIALLFLSLICTAGTKFVWLFLGKYIIKYISLCMEERELLLTVSVLTLVSIICTLGLNLVNFWKEPAAFYVRPMFMLKRNLKHIGMFYQDQEDKEILDAVEKSRHSTCNVDVGIEGIIRFTLDFVTSLSVCLLSVLILCLLNPLMALFVLVFGLLFYFSINKASKKEKQFTVDEAAYAKRKFEYFKNVSNDYSYGKDIRVYGLQGKLLNTLQSLQDTLHGKVIKARIEWIKSGLINNFLDLLKEIIMYGGLVYFILIEKADISDFLVYIGCVHNLSESFENLLKTFAKLRKCSSETDDYRNLNAYTDDEGDITSNVTSKSSEESEAAFESASVATAGDVFFDNVSFKYPGSDTYAVKNLSIHINTGEKLAVVGLNGAGKTTFVKLLLKLYKPESGVIYYNGRDINTLDAETYYKTFSPVFQDMECYAFTLAENVSMCPAEETDNDLVIKCLNEAGLGDKLKSLKHGLQTPVSKIVSDDGIEFSGGEKQKLALARALYKDAPVVVLDEPTAALDALAESSMYEHFDSLIKDKTAVYISHRLASTRFCDNIAFFENGEIKEYGSHNDLIDKNGKYAEMFRMQAQYYVKEDDNEEINN